MKRSHTCWSCAHRGETGKSSTGRPETVKCTITKRTGKLARGHDCEHFECAYKGQEFGDDGYPIKNRQPLDYRTANQWRDSGMRIRSGEKGTLMHPTRMIRQLYEYFLIEQTEPVENSPADGTACNLKRGTSQ